jgi:asparagine synthase (glutamine-hydrolysing)
MIQSMMHELFYNSGLYTNNQLCLWIGWTCLEGSFADCMPIWNENRDIGLIFTGEDFRRADDVALLKTGGHDFNLNDASYLVHMYEEFGPEFFLKINGWLSGLIIDLRTNRLLLFNDRYGLNRIYFHEKDGALFFASEAKALLEVLPELRRLDLACLAETFSYGCVLRNKTLFSDISLMPGGSLWTISPNQRIAKAYYFRPASWECQDSLSSREYYEKLKHTWSRILPQYLRTNGRIAISLTGGKDSRMIMAWARLPPGALPCYTFGGLYRDSYDVRLAGVVAETCRQPHQVIRVGEDFIDDFPALAKRTIFLTDGTMDVSGASELYVNKIARSIAPVRLTGNYGQEILRNVIAFKPRRLDERILDARFSKQVKEAEHIYENEIAGVKRSVIAFKQVPWHHYSRLALESSQVSLRSPFLDNELVALAYRAPGNETGTDLQLRLIAEGNPALSKMMTDRGLFDDTGRISAKMKHAFQEFTFKAEYAYDYGMPHVLTIIDSMLGQLHVEHLFLGRHKFYHYRIWYRDKLARFVKEILLDPIARKRPYLRGGFVESMVKAHTSGMGNFTLEIHRLLTSELIQRLFID